MEQNIRISTAIITLKEEAFAEKSKSAKTRKLLPAKLSSFKEVNEKHKATYLLHVQGRKYNNISRQI